MFGLHLIRLYVYHGLSRMFFMFGGLLWDNFASNLTYISWSGAMAMGIHSTTFMFVRAPFKHLAALTSCNLGH